MPSTHEMPRTRTRGPTAATGDGNRAGTFFNLGSHPATADEWTLIYIVRYDPAGNNFKRTIDGIGANCAWGYVNGW